MAKKVYILLGILLLMATGGIAWYLWNEGPQKVPVRSKSVWLYRNESPNDFYAWAPERYDISIPAHTMLIIEL